MFELPTNRHHRHTQERVKRHCWNEHACMPRNGMHKKGMIESLIEHDPFLYAGHSSDLLITEPHGEILDIQLFTNPFIVSHKCRNFRFSIESNKCDSDRTSRTSQISSSSTSTRPFVVPNETHKNRDFSIECNERALFV